MKASDLIKELQKGLEHCGDAEIELPNGSPLGDLGFCTENKIYYFIPVEKLEEKRKTAEKIY